MQTIFSSSEMDRQKRDYHVALLRTDFFEEPIVLTEGDHDLPPTRLQEGTYLIQTQKNRYNAPISHFKIDIMLALEIRAELNHDRNKAIDMMLRAVS